jgi:hypothetical protein
VISETPAALAARREWTTSVGKVIGIWGEVERKYKDAPLEDDDEIDLVTEMVHRSDGSTAPWLPDGDQSLSDWVKGDVGDEDDSIQAGPSRRRIVSRNPEDADDDTESDPDSHDDVESGEGTESEEEDDELGSWQNQEDEIKAQLEHRKAALLLASFRNRREQDSDEEMAEFLRDEEAARARRMSARAEGRDSRCHTDRLTESVKSESDSPPPEPRSPSKFSTLIVEAAEDLFAEDESGEDELALTSSDRDLDGNHEKSKDPESDVSGLDPPKLESWTDMQAELQMKTASTLAEARQVRSLWSSGESSTRRLGIVLSPDSSPEPETTAGSNEPGVSRKISTQDTRPKQAVAKASKVHRDVPPTAPATSGISKSNGVARVREPPSVKPIRRKDRKGKSRMAGERPDDVAVLDDVFGPREPIDPQALDRKRYRHSRYRQKASDNYKTCRYCRTAEPARAKLSEYCRGANHSKHCTFEFPPKIFEPEPEQEDKVEPDQTSSATRITYWKHKSPGQSPTTFEASTPAPAKRSGLTSNGLERWRYFENLVKRPDKQTDRSCPYCRVSEDFNRLKNATYCRGRIESRDCTFDGHKGSLRVSSKTKRSHEKPTPSQPPIKAEVATPKTPSHTPSAPDQMVDESKLDHKLYYSSLIRDQSQNGYRYCVGCARSGDSDRQRLRFWCRGRISFKTCGHWDGDASGHRQRRQQSGLSTQPTFKTASKSQVPDMDKPDISKDSIDPTADTHLEKDATRESREDFGATPSRKRGRPRKSIDSVSAPLQQEVPAVGIQTTPLPQGETVKSVQRPQTEPVKRKPGRPRKTPLPDTREVVALASEPSMRIDDQPSRPFGVTSTDSTVAEVSDQVKRKPGKLQPTINMGATSDVVSDDAPPRERTVKPEKTPKVRPGQIRHESRDDRHVRRKRSRTFDIVIPTSRTGTPPASSPTPNTDYDHDQNLGPLVPISAMRNSHVTHASPKHGLEHHVGIRELGSLPPSSPPASLSPSASPQPIRFMPSGHRSSPLASVHQQDRSSTARSAGSTPIRGILRQSSEASDAPRKRARVSFSLVRSPSPESESDEMDYDSDSSDDVLLLVEPSSSSRHSAPPSSRRNGTSSPSITEPRFVESPLPGRLSSSTLAAYARPLDRVPLDALVFASSSAATPPQAARHYASQRSPLSSSPVTSRSVPPSSGRGLMLPPPVPAYKLSSIPQSEPRPTGSVQRGQGAASRPRSTSMSTEFDDRQPAKKMGAENIVIRRLIDDFR